MSADLLTELTHDTADSSRRNARFVRSFAVDLREKSIGDQRTTELLLHEFVARAIRFGAETIPIWEATVELLKSRPRSSSAKLMVEAAIEAFDSWRILEGETRRLLEAASLRSLVVDAQRLREFDGAALGVAGLKAKASALLAALDRPWPEPDAARLAAGRDDAAEGRMMKAEEVKAAVLAARK